MDHKVYDSNVQSNDLQLKAPYYNAIVPTTILFAQEKISAFVNSLGHLEFFDDAGNSLGFVDIPVHKDPAAYAHSAQYGEVLYSAQDNLIVFSFPVYYWTDSYPHCDGESDRWSRHISRWFRVTFDCAAHQLSVLDN